MEALRKNLIALLSLVVAVGALSYGAYRNEQSERNRNIRVACFEVLKNLGELQTLVHYAHYDKDPKAGNPIGGWGRVLLIQDLAMVLPEPMPSSTQRLFQAWQRNFDGIGEEEAPAERILAGIREARGATLEVLKGLR